MYGLPDDFDGSVFVGRELVQVSFTANTVHLSFDDDVSITIEARFTIHLDGAREEHAPPVRASRLMALIGRSVRLVDASADGTLTLQFDRSDALTCLDDSKQFESYHLYVRGREIIV